MQTGLYELNPYFFFSRNSQIVSTAEQVLFQKMCSILFATWWFLARRRIVPGGVRCSYPQLVNVDLQSRHAELIISAYDISHPTLLHTYLLSCSPL
jgi:hypothetical protein